MFKGGWGREVDPGSNTTGHLSGARVLLMESSGECAFGEVPPAVEGKGARNSRFSGVAGIGLCWPSCCKGRGIEGSNIIGLLGRGRFGPGQLPAALASATVAQVQASH